MKTVYASLLLGLVGMTYASCPHMDPVAGFQESWKTGDWYLLGSSVNQEGSGLAKLTCEEMYAFKHDGTWKMTGSGLDEDHKRIANWTETGADGSAPGAFDYVNPSAGPFDLTVIGHTEHCMVLYSCNLPFKNTPYAWIYSRTPKTSFNGMADDEKKEVTEILTHSGFDMDHMNLRDNTAC